MQRLMLRLNFKLLNKQTNQNSYGNNGKVKNGDGLQKYVECDNGVYASSSDMGESTCNIGREQLGGPTSQRGSANARAMWTFPPRHGNAGICQIGIAKGHHGRVEGSVASPSDVPANKTLFPGAHTSAK